jgi:hypothetical protein
LAGGINTFGYVGGSPLSHIDYYGLDTYGFSFNINAGWGAGFTAGVNFVADDSGNIAMQTTAGAGGDTPGASAMVNFETTNAKTVYDLTGYGAQVGVDGGVIVGLEAGKMYGKGYSGWYGGGGLVVGPTPVGASGMPTFTENVFTPINIPGLISDLMSPEPVDEKVMDQFCKQNPNASNCINRCQ